MTNERKEIFVVTTIALIHPQAASDMLGFIPLWLARSGEEAKFVDGVNTRYVSKWHSHKSGQLDTSNGDYRYPGDPLMKPYVSIMRAAAHEIIFAYPHAFFAVVTITPEVARQLANGGLLPADLEWDMARLD